MLLSHARFSMLAQQPCSLTISLLTFSSRIDDNAIWHVDFQLLLLMRARAQYVNYYVSSYYTRLQNFMVCILYCGYALLSCLLKYFGAVDPSKNKVSLSFPVEIWVMRVMYYRIYTQLWVLYDDSIMVRLTASPVSSYYYYG